MTLAHDDAADMSAVLVALADPTRRQLLDTLASKGEATATTLAERLPVSRQAIVKHLAVLAGARLVAGHKHGREMRYTVRPEPLGAAAAWMTKVAHSWDTRLARIKQIAESQSPADQRNLRGT